MSRSPCTFTVPRSPGSAAASGAATTCRCWLRRLAEIQRLLLLPVIRLFRPGQLAPARAAEAHPLVERPGAVVDVGDPEHDAPRAVGPGAFAHRRDEIIGYAPAACPRADPHRYQVPAPADPGTGLIAGGRLGDARRDAHRLGVGPGDELRPGGDPGPPELLRMIDLAIQGGAEGLRGLGQRRQPELPQRGPVVRHGLADLAHGPSVVARHALDRARPASAAQHVIRAADIVGWPWRPWRSGGPGVLPALAFCRPWRSSRLSYGAGDPWRA